MSVISFEDWKKERERRSAYTSGGHLREDVWLKEAYGFDLCSFIAEEANNANMDADYTATLWQDLDALIASLPHEHGYHYFIAFKAFLARQFDDFYASFDRFLQSERALHEAAASSDWWVEHFLWIFLPPFPGFYAQCSQLFDKHWPLCAMSWICKALEQNELEQENIDISLEFLHMALKSESDNFLACYVIASLYFDQKQWQNAFLFFEKAAASELYREDASFLFDCAWSAEKSGQFSAACAYYESCIALDETYPCALNNLGCLQMHNGQNEQAFHTFMRAIDLSLDASLPYRNALSALEQQEKYREAIDFVSAHADHFGPGYQMEIDRLTILQETVPLLSPELRAQLPSLALHAVDFAARKRLAALIADEIQHGSPLFGHPMDIYQDENGYGVQYFLLGAGQIDILGVSPDQQHLYVVSVVDSIMAETDLLRIFQQVKLVQEGIATENQHVTGYIICRQVHPIVQIMLQQSPFDALQVFQLSFTLQPLLTKN